MRTPARRFPLLPRRKNTDKSAYGHALIVAGSRRMTGAAVLAATAALRSGAGLVTLASPEGAADVLRRKLPPEAMFLPLPQTPAGSVSLGALKPLLDFIRKRRVGALAVGPGLSAQASTTALVRRLVRSAAVPAVVDADGLNAFKGRADELQASAGPLVLTPHDREFARLFDQVPPQSRDARLRLAWHVSKSRGLTVVLKGHRTVVSDGRHAFVNSTGNPGMAKGGTGDVLTGMIAAFLAQGLRPFDAASWAVYFHGRAGDLAVQKTGELGLTASDLIEYLPKAFR